MRTATTAAMVLAALSIAGGGSAAFTDTARAATPHCFGAAARDPENPCSNRQLDYVARPTPARALLESVAPCTTVRSSEPGVCAFGASGQNVASTVAVLGDSHAVHWRPALSVVARTKRWRGLSITRSNCPFTYATTPGKGQCGGWARSVVRWLTGHPDVHTVFVSANSGSGVVARRGRYSETKTSGYIRAWKALPPSVAEVFVIHDVPHSGSNTRRCVQGALTHHRKPGLHCARPRKAALAPDLEVAAAKKAADTRVKVIDLTPFMCSARTCFPVVGGALVIKDIGHLTRTFSATCGKFLGRAVNALRALG